MLQVAGHLFIIPTYHNKQWQLRLGLRRWEKLPERRETKISGEQRGAGGEGLISKGRERERTSECACVRGDGGRLTAVITCRGTEEEQDSARRR